MAEEKCPYHYACDERFKKICMKIEMVEKINRERFDKQREALNLATAILDKRLETMNEIRGHLVDQAKTFITKAEVELKFEAVRIKYDPLITKKNFDEGANTIKIVVVSALVTVLVGISLHYIFKF